MSEKEKREYQDKLGEKLGAVFYGVQNDWLTALIRLREYRLLFTDPNAVKLLNSVSSGGFMWDVQQILWHDLLLHVTRLTDPATMGGHENLSVQALPLLCGSPDLKATYPELQAQVQSRVETAVAAAEFARPWRNRRISHSDLGLAIDPEAESLNPTTLRQVQAGARRSTCCHQSNRLGCPRSGHPRRRVDGSTGGSVPEERGEAGHGGAVCRLDHRPEWRCANERCRRSRGLSHKAGPRHRRERDHADHRTAQGGAEVPLRTDQGGAGTEAKAKGLADATSETDGQVHRSLPERRN